LKTTWTCSRESIALIPPRTSKEELKEIYALSDKKFGGHVTITIETPRKPRTTGENSQSHHLNGHIQQLAVDTGMPFDSIKLEVKYLAVGMGYPMLYKPDGAVQTDIWGRVMGISEADSSTQECAILIEATHQLASELGMILKEE